MLLTQPLKKNTEFRQVYSRGKSAANRLLVLYVWPNHGPSNRLGVSVSKKVGNAVTRNRVKRWIKESYRLGERGILTGYDMVVVARVSIAALPRETAFEEIGRGLMQLIKKHNLQS